MRYLALLGVLAAVVTFSSAAAAAFTAGFATAANSDEPLTLEFDASGSAPDSGRTIVGYTWNFGDGTTGSGMKTAHGYPAAGVYVVTLTVTDDAGATASASVPVAVQAVRLDLAETSVVWGSQIAASGSVEPVAADLELVVEQAGETGWAPLGRAVTDSAGHFALLVAPERSGALRARVTSSGAVGPARPVSVVPKVVFERIREGVAFVGARVVARVHPADYEAPLAVTVRRRGKFVASAVARVRDGRLTFIAPTPGIGRFNAFLELRPAAGLGPRRVVVEVRARAPQNLGPGARGRAVIALARRLGALGFHLPAARSVLGPPLADVVVAFQKAAGLRETGTVVERDWRALARAEALEPRYRLPAEHLELDVGRQLLLVVRERRVTGALSVVVRRADTRRGAFLLRAGSPLATTWLGSVEVPRWAARWLDRHSRVGSRVFVYGGPTM